MNSKTYLERVELYTEGMYVLIGTTHDCPDCEHFDENGDIAFSNSHCDGCGSRLPGSRHAAHLVHKGRPITSENIVHAEICVDCLMFHANGDLPEGEQ